MKTLGRLLPQFIKNRIVDRLIRGNPEKADMANMKAIAINGDRSDECLAAGFLPVPVHFYSPIPDLGDLEARGVWDRRTAMAGIDFRPEAQVEIMLDLGQHFGDECRWSPDPTDNPLEFYTENDSFCFGCAASTYAVIRGQYPERVIEIGSGFSSLVISAAMVKNHNERWAEKRAEMLSLCDYEPGQNSEYTIVDPYPGEVVKHGLPCLTALTKARVETLHPSFFDSLGEGDILFIDSGHCVRIGGDVNYLILEVLPRLAPGVVVHFHDIPMPFEYNRALATTSAFRQFWTESYLLQAFLCNNDQFEVLLAMQWLMTERAGQFREAFPHYDPEVHKNFSGSSV